MVLGLLYKHKYTLNTWLKHSLVPGKNVTTFTRYYKRKFTPYVVHTEDLHKAHFSRPNVFSMDNACFCYCFFGFCAGLIIFPCNQHSHIIAIVIRPPSLKSFANQKTCQIKEWSCLKNYLFLHFWLLKRTEFNVLLLGYYPLSSIKIMLFLWKIKSSLLTGNSPTFSCCVLLDLNLVHSIYIRTVSSLKSVH